MTTFECQLSLSAKIEAPTPALAREEFIDRLVYGRLFNPDLDMSRISVKSSGRRLGANH